MPGLLILAALVAAGQPTLGQKSKDKDKPKPKPHTGSSKSDPHDNESHKGSSPIVATWTPIHTGYQSSIDGGAGLTLSSNGKWQFTGHFYNKSGRDNRVAIVFGVKSHGADGALYLFEATGVTKASGGRTYSWDKSGTSRDLKNHWSDLAKGHAWHSQVCYVEAYQNPPTFANFNKPPTFTLPPLSNAGIVNAVEMKLKAVGPVTIVCR
ncbi:MAG TPA: hypothetical protein VKT78_07975 [Fimbriimonadaceae bacterium]|nr:hypothetical protein [Fimbriimonadaceae bacterium]